MPYYIYRLVSEDKYRNTKYHYIGSTPRPQNRIRQHNGIITGGAKYTKSKLGRIKNKWYYDFVMLTSMNKVQALSLEWQLKHPFPLIGKRKKQSRFSKNINEMLNQIDITLEYTINKTNSLKSVYILMMNNDFKKDISYKPTFYNLMFVEDLTKSIIDRHIISDMDDLCYALNPILQV